VGSPVIQLTQAVNVRTGDVIIYLELMSMPAGQLINYLTNTCQPLHRYKSQMTEHLMIQGPAHDHGWWETQLKVSADLRSLCCFRQMIGPMTHSSPQTRS